MEWDVYQINKEKHNFLGSGRTEISVEMKSRNLLRANKKTAMLIQ
jgi:hypothetical protein